MYTRNLGLFSLLLLWQEHPVAEISVTPAPGTCAERLFVSMPRRTDSLCGPPSIFGSVRQMPLIAAMRGISSWRKCRSLMHDKNRRHNGQSV